MWHSEFTIQLDPRDLDGDLGSNSRLWLTSVPERLPVRAVPYLLGQLAGRTEALHLPHRRKPQDSKN